MYKHLNSGNQLTKPKKESDEYHIDERSGDEISDSEKEFDSIIEIDNMLKELTEGVFEEGEITVKIMKLVNKLYELRDLIEFDSQILKDIMCKLVPLELLNFTNFT